MIKTSITHRLPVLKNENVLCFKILTQLTWSINGLLKGLDSLRTSVQSSALRLRTKYLWQTHHQKSNSSFNLKIENRFNSHVHNKMLQNKYLSPGILWLWRWRQQDSMNVMKCIYDVLPQKIWIFNQNTWIFNTNARTFDYMHNFTPFLPLMASSTYCMQISTLHLTL